MLGQQQLIICKVAFNVISLCHAIIILLLLSATQRCVVGAGACSNLIEIDAASNRISCLPEAFSTLSKLKILRLDRNLVASVPPLVLQRCTMLSTLGLHDNPITANQLRETTGFEEFEARRRGLCDKQIEMSVLPAAGGKGFSEGADLAEWERYK